MREGLKRKWLACRPLERKARRRGGIWLRGCRDGARSVPTNGCFLYRRAGTPKIKKDAKGTDLCHHVLLFCLKDGTRNVSDYSTNSEPFIWWSPI